MSVAQVVTGSVNLNATATEQLALGGTTTYCNVQSLPVYQFANGNGTSVGNVIDDHFELTITLAASASTTLTLSALTDSIGRAVAFVDVSVYMIQSIIRTAGDYLTVGGAATHPWVGWSAASAPTYKVWDLDLKVSGLTDGVPVVSGTSDQLQIANSGSHSITFKITLWGRSV